jgi:hypothetical protein
MDDEADRERRSAEHEQRSGYGPDESRQAVNDGLGNHVGATM